MKRGWERENFISEWGTSTPHIQKEYNLTYSRKYGSTLLQKQKLKDILTFSIRFSFWFYQRWKSQSLFVCLFFCWSSLLLFLCSPCPHIYHAQECILSLPFEVKLIYPHGQPLSLQNFNILLDRQPIHYYS